MKSCTARTCAVSSHCELGNASSNCRSDWMTCYTVGNGIWPHHGSACDGKGLSFLKMSSGTSHKIFVFPSTILTSFLVWRSALTVTEYCKSPVSLSRQKTYVLNRRHTLYLKTFSSNFEPPVFRRVKITDKLHLSFANINTVTKHSYLFRYYRRFCNICLF